MVTDQRKNARATFKTEIWLGQDGIFTRTALFLKDLSEGGAFVETTQLFPVGTILNFRFKLPTVTQPISCSVSVRNHRNGTGLGVQFLDISSDDRLRLHSFLTTWVFTSAV